jgi:hypothetical protein
MMVKVAKENAIVFLGQARKAVEKAKSLPDLKNLRDKAESVRKYCKAIGESKAIQNHAAEIKLRAERKAGELLAEMDLHGGDRKSTSREVRLKLEEFGISYMQSHRWQLEAGVPEEDFEAFLVSVTGSDQELTTAALLKIAKSFLAKGKLEKRTKDAAKKAPRSSGKFRLHTCAVNKLSAHVQAESVDAIITDPPYPREFLPCYEALSAFGAHALRPGGVCLVMTGQSHLEAVLRLLSTSLEYQWTLAYMTPGQYTPIFGRKVKSNWKPVVFLTKGKNVWENVFDVLESDMNDKRFHEWGQSEGGTAQIIERFTVPKMVVCDPFVGGGTTGVAAIQLDRFFIGADIEKKHVETTAERLSQ